MTKRSTYDYDSDEVDPVVLEEGRVAIGGGIINSITITSGKAVTIRAGATIGGHLVANDLQLTNTSDLSMKVVFNDEANTFELQPIGEAPDLV